jgi:hypothetical protein
MITCFTLDNCPVELVSSSTHPAWPSGHIMISSSVGNGDEILNRLGNNTLQTSSGSAFVLFFVFF